MAFNNGVLKRQRCYHNVVINVYVYVSRIGIARVYNIARVNVRSKVIGSVGSCVCGVARINSGVVGGIVGNVGRSVTRVDGRVVVRVNVNGVVFYCYIVVAILAVVVVAVFYRNIGTIVGDVGCGVVSGIGNVRMVKRMYRRAIVFPVNAC